MRMKPFDYIVFMTLVAIGLVLFTAIISALDNLLYIPGKSFFHVAIWEDNQITQSFACFTYSGQIGEERFYAEGNYEIPVTRRIGQTVEIWEVKHDK